LALQFFTSAVSWAATPSGGGVDAGAARGNVLIPPVKSHPLTPSPALAPDQAISNRLQPGAVGQPSFGSARIAGFSSDVEHDAIGPGQITPLIGQQVTEARWQSISSHLWESYRAQGYLVRIDLLLDGKGAARVKVSQLRVHALKVSAAPGVAADEKIRFEQIARSEIVAGAPVDLPRLEALIRRFYYRNQEIAQIDMSSFDRATVDISLSLQPPRLPAIDKPWRISVDNYGLDDLGRTRISASAQVSPAASGDLLSVNALTSAGLKAVDLRYDLPAPLMWPLRFALDYNYLNYSVQHTAPGEGQDGDAQTVRLEASYPQFFWGGGMLTHTLSVDQVHASDNLADINTDNKEMNNLRYRALALNFAGGRANGLLELTWGHLSLGGDQAQAQDSVAQTQGEYSKAYGEASWNQNLGAALTLDTRLRGQMASKNLDSLEKFSLGGVSAVRAYDADQARGDQGLAGSIDLWARPLNDQPLRVGVFADWGMVQSQRKPWVGSGDPNRYDLNAGGAELSYDYQALNLILTAAHPLTQSNVVTNSGWRLWAEASLRF